MITGIGIDLTEVERIGLSISGNPGFREHVFSVNEIAYCQSKGHPFEHYAARFAGKEAFFKALGTGWQKDLDFSEIEIISDAEGKPEINFLGKSAVSMAGINPGKIFISLSHTKTMATAMVIIEN